MCELYSDFLGGQLGEVIDEVHYVSLYLKTVPFNSFIYIAYVCEK